VSPASHNPSTRHVAGATALKFQRVRYGQDRLQVPQPFFREAPENLSA
jgi:hypothetical protein